jgi:hypothetical protein
VADLRASFRNVFGARPLGAVDARGERDLVGDLTPFVFGALVAWWTTVRPAAFGVGGTWPTRIAAGCAVAGIAATAGGIVRGTRYFVPLVVAAFILPCAITWFLGRESATALSEPLEIFVGAVAWTTLGIVLMRPQAVAAPTGAAGSRGPTIGAGDDVARVAMREVEAEFAREEPQARLTPRQKQPRLAALPLIVAAIIASCIGIMVVRIGTNEPERAILARIAGAAVVIAVLSTAGDLVEVRYLTRKPPKPRTRLQRTLVTFAVLAVLAFIGFVFIAGRGE